MAHADVPVTPYALYAVYALHAVFEVAGFGVSDDMEICFIIRQVILIRSP